MLIRDYWRRQRPIKRTVFTLEHRPCFVTPLFFAISCVETDNEVAFAVRKHGDNVLIRDNDTGVAAAQLVFPFDFELHVGSSIEDSVFRMKTTGTIIAAKLTPALCLH